MIDFLAQTKLPGVLIAKAMINKINFDELLRRDKELKERLQSIGYIVKLNLVSQSSLTSILDEELRRTSQLVEKIQYQAEVFSNILTTTFKKLAEKSEEDTPTIYHLAQFIFIWDEFIDFDDYQRYHGDKSKIRESVFYRAAAIVMQEIDDKQLKRLESMDINREAFENALLKLQLLNTRENFETDSFMLILETLKAAGLPTAETVYFLLVIESALFIQVSEILLSTSDREKVAVLKSVSRLRDGIEKTREIFDLDADQLESMLEQEAKSFIKKVRMDIFL